MADFEKQNKIIGNTFFNSKNLKNDCMLTKKNSSIAIFKKTVC